MTKKDNRMPQNQLWGKNYLQLNLSLKVKPDTGKSDRNSNIDCKFYSFELLKYPALFLYCQIRHYTRHEIPQFWRYII